MTKLKLLCAMLVMFASVPAHAVKVFSTPEGAALNVGLLLQPQLQFVEIGALNGTSTSTDFFLRRIRLVVSGNITKKLSFFVQTDQPNFGARVAGGGRNFDVDQFYIQDAIFSYAALES